jgi:hypothetical protein
MNHRIVSRPQFRSVHLSHDQEVIPVVGLGFYYREMRKRSDDEKI